MEAKQQSNKLVFQADFVFSPVSQKISFLCMPGNLFPVGKEQEFPLEKFAAFFIQKEQQQFIEFFDPASWSDKSLFLTISTDPANYTKGESCSVFLRQNGTENSNLSGTMVNITQFLPGELLYRDLAVFVDGLGHFRKITHDLNNQFQIITGFGSALEDEMTDPELKECATNVMDAVGKAIDQNKELRKFFPPKDKPKLYIPNYANVVSNTAARENTAAAPPQVNTSPTTAAAPQAAENTNAGILVIDDEPLVQRFLCEMLKRLKYSARGCATGNEALALMNENPELFSLAIVDMNLPDINSESLFDQLLQSRPDLKVILISGDNLGESSQRILDKGAHGFLQKPTTIKTLAETIGQILAGVSTSA